MQTQQSKVDMGKALNVGLVVTESSGTEPEKHDTSSRSRNDSYAEDANSKPVNDKEPMADVYLNAEDNVLANDNSMLSNSNSIMKKGLTKMLNNCAPILKWSYGQMASEQFGSGHKLQLMTPGTISPGLVQNSSSSTPHVPPTKKD
ncbi:hypothetical protein Tco_1204699 [Tanacetum coccineum]